MKILVLLIVVFSLASHCAAQSRDSVIVYRFFDVAPAMLDGSDYRPAVTAMLHRTIDKKKLTAVVREQKRIFITFVVDTTGKAGSAMAMLLNGNAVTKSVVDVEISHAIDGLPRFLPGKKDGKIVNASLTVPLH